MRETGTAIDRFTMVRTEIRRTRTMTTEQPELHDEDNRMNGTSIMPAIRPAESVDKAKKKQLERAGAPAKITIEQLNFYYSKTRALKDITLSVPPNQVTAFIGPSGCGKSTLLRTLNRMNDVIPGTRVEGKVRLDGEDIYAQGTDVVSLRQRVGMVFQKSNPFPRSIFDNVAYGLHINKLTSSRAELT